MKIAADILQILDRSTTEGARLVLPEQLDRKAYVAANDVIVAAGGKWDRKAKAHVFVGDAAAAIDPILMTGEYVRAKQEFGQFDTPQVVVDRLIALSGIRAGARVLEPSVGIGNIALACEAAGAIVTGLEIDAGRAAVARERCSLAGGLTIGDFLTTVPDGEGFDVVVMNPPFARQVDIAHVEHATRFLKPGGRLVSVMGAGVTFRENRISVAFREMVAARGGAIERLPENSFRSSGTGVLACVISFDSP